MALVLAACTSLVLTSGLYKDALISIDNCYTTLGKDYMIHTSSSMERLFSRSCLKWEGVSPVTFLNWVERCATLL
jgi:hypothetical protein